MKKWKYAKPKPAPVREENVQAIRLTLPTVSERNSYLEHLKAYLIERGWESEVERIFSMKVLECQD